MTIDLTQIILAVITLIGGLIARYLIPWIKSKLDADQYNTFISLVRVGVYAAQQLYPKEKGKDKFEYVCEILKLNGYDVDSPTVRATIEAEVKKLKMELETVEEKKDQVKDQEAIPEPEK